MKKLQLLGKKTKYNVSETGKWYPVSKICACCDCGLVHRYEYRYSYKNNKFKLEQRSMRDARRTAALRRGRKAAIIKRIKEPAKR